ncbi:hypothetical protein [Microcystis aeruginosa]|uniref:hypothetical protein n=1 Tax=Microcystis aeruginosa TaxID=1126 RepID=UPI001F503FC1|nr:hypothetical protein [Microcystis aeruginosa]
MISLTYIGAINLCVLCVFVVPSTPSLGRMYLICLKDQSFKFKLKLCRTSSPDKSLGLSKISTSFP